MLQNLPDFVGHALRDQRAGLDQLAFNRLPLRAGQGAIKVTSLAFADHGPLPRACTADGEGHSPPLQWTDVPPAAHGVVLIVEEFADDETLDAMGIDDPFDLTGLYHGRPVGEKSSFESGALPDRIHLYRRALLDEWCATGVDLRELITHVVVHEVGHHFGLSDDDMHALEASAS